MILPSNIYDKYHILYCQKTELRDAAPERCCLTLNKAIYETLNGHGPFNSYQMIFDFYCKIE